MSEDIIKVILRRAKKGFQTNAILRKGVTIEEIKKAISEKYTDVKVFINTTDYIDYAVLEFKDGKQMYKMLISFNNSCEIDYGISGVLCNLTSSGDSRNVLGYLCEIFGGFIGENYINQYDFHPINHHLYLGGSNHREIDEFRIKVIKKVGYNKLNIVMSLFEEYSDIIKK